MGKKIGCGIIAVLIIVLGAFLGFRYYWVFGEGVKAGELNYFMKKGYIFKTYEGRIIQAGIRSGKTTTKTTTTTSGGIQSNEFSFSVENETIGDSLMRCSGKVVELHYKEYKAALPWRGMSECVVDSIISVKESTGTVY